MKVILVLLLIESDTITQFSCIYYLKNSCEVAQYIPDQCKET